MNLPAQRRPSFLLRRPRGFTLVELIVSAAVVALIVGLAVPAYTVARARSQSAACLSNLRSLGFSVQAYLNDHDNVMPTLAAAKRPEDDEALTIAAWPEYVQDSGTLICPADPTRGNRTGTSYYWNSALNGQRASNLNFLNLTDSHGRIPVLCDKDGWHRFTRSKVNVLYADGHAREGLRFSAGD